jgi:hypothetical protein
MRWVSKAGRASGLLRALKLRLQRGKLGKWRIRIGLAFGALAPFLEAGPALAVVRRARAIVAVPAMRAAAAMLAVMLARTLIRRSV